MIPLGRGVPDVHQGGGGTRCTSERGVPNVTFICIGKEAKTGPKTMNFRCTDPVQLI